MMEASWCLKNPFDSKEKGDLRVICAGLRSARFVIPNSLDNWAARSR